MILFEDFAKLDLRIATIVGATRVEGSEKLLRLCVELGQDAGNNTTELRQIIAGIGTGYAPEDIIQTQIVIIANLQPRMLMGLESQGMLLAASDAGGPVLLQPQRRVCGGAQIR